MPETLEYGVSSFVLRERRPFHPQRLMTAIPSKGMKAVVRSKGFVWLASHPNHTFLWSQAGKQLSLNPQGPWQCLGALRHSSSSRRTLIRERLTARDGAGGSLVPEGERPTMGEDPDWWASMAQWDPVWGDRLTELVLIGVRMDQERVRISATHCLAGKPQTEEGGECSQHSARSRCVAR